MRVFTIVGLALLLVLAGCLGRSPEVAHYLLGGQLLGGQLLGDQLREGQEAGGAAAGTLAPEETTGPAILVGPVRLPAYLDRPQLARLERGGRLELDEYARWVGGFEENFLRAVAHDLARRTGSIRIAVAPSKAPFPFDAQVRLHVDDLVAVDGTTLRVRIRWAIHRFESDAPAELFVMDESRPLADDDDETLVAAHEEVLRDLAGRIEAAIR